MKSHLHKLLMFVLSLSVFAAKRSASGEAEEKGQQALNLEELLISTGGNGWHLLRSHIDDYLSSLSAPKSGFWNGNKMLSIRFLDDCCQIEIRLENTSDSPLLHTTFFGMGSNKDRPWDTWFYVRDADYRLISGVPGMSHSGYTSGIFSSDIVTLRVLRLSPGEFHFGQFPLKKFCIGIFEKTQVKRENIENYQIKIKTVVDLDMEGKRRIEADTPWVKFPKGLLDKE